MSTSFCAVPVQARERSAAASPADGEMAMATCTIGRRPGYRDGHRGTSRLSGVFQPAMTYGVRPSRQPDDQILRGQVQRLNRLLTQAVYCLLPFTAFSSARGHRQSGQRPDRYANAKDRGIPEHQRAPSRFTGTRPHGNNASSCFPERRQRLRLSPPRGNVSLTASV